MSTDAARQLYEAMPTSKPAWEQLGTVTQQVWQEKAERRAAGDPHWYSCLPPAAAQPTTPDQGDLF